MATLSETRTFRCAGCDDLHHLDARWSITGPAEAPSATPSLLVRSGHHAPGWRDGDGCWCGTEDAAFGCHRCHLYVRDGRLEYLADSTHHLAGQAVPLEVC